jgi:hypothetical protein
VAGKKAAFPASGKVNAAPDLTSLKDGRVTLTVTEVEPSGNQTISTTTLTKATGTPATPTVALNPADDSGVSSTDYTTNVKAPRFTVTGQSGVTATIYINGTVYTGQALTDGSYTVTATLTDPYGNVSQAGTAPHMLVIDTSAPTGSFTIPGKVINGQLATNNKTPTLTLSFSDAGAGIANIQVSTNGGATYGAAQAYSSNVPVTLGADGLYTIAIKLTDVAGNVTVVTQTVRLQTAGPTISASLSGPITSGWYDMTGDIIVSWSASDQSGIASTTLKLDNATTLTGSVIDIDTLSAGTHTLVITSVDNLGNASSTTLTFQIHPTLSGLTADVKEGTTHYLISSSEQTTLLNILNNTTNLLKTNLTNFINEVKSKSGTSAITTAEANLLQNWAQDLYSRS